MNKSDVAELLCRHDQEITELQKATAQMMQLWRLVGAVALVCLGTWLAVNFGGAA